MTDARSHSVLSVFFIYKPKSVIRFPLSFAFVSLSLFSPGIGTFSDMKVWQKSAKMRNFSSIRRTFALIQGVNSVEYQGFVFFAALCGLGTDLGVAGDEVFVGGDFGQSHRSAGVELLCGDAYFGSEAKLSAVGERGG